MSGPGPAPAAATGEPAIALDWGREVTGALPVAEAREWLVADGLGGFASGTVSGLLTRRYHGLLLAALKPPLGRTLLVSKLDEVLEVDGQEVALHANRWADQSVSPPGYRHIQRFRLEGTTPVWTYAWADVRLDKRIFSAPGQATTYVRYTLLEAPRPVTLTIKAFVNYRDYHGTTRGSGWTMQVEPVPGGIRVTAFDGARPVTLVASGGESLEVRPAHVWHYGFQLAREQERGLDAQDDHLQAATFRVTLGRGAALTVACSAASDPPPDGAGAWRARLAHEADLLASFAATGAVARSAPAWIRQLVLAADQFVVRRPLPDDPEGRSILAGYHWFGDWGRDTMIALPGLSLSTGRPEVARRVLTTFARFVDQGMLPNRFPDAGEAPEYNTVDATLWYVEAIRAYHAATQDDATLKELYPVLEEIVRWHRQGTRYGIGEDPGDGLLRAGAPGVQLTWMDARIGDWVVTPRIGKPVEINALWYNALRTLAAFARRLDQPAAPWDALAARVRGSFGRFWNEVGGYCYDVVDGPGGDDDTLRPNQVFAVSLPESPLSPSRQRRVVEMVGRHLLTSHGLRSLAPGHPAYRGRYAGGPAERDAIYHQGPVWGWLLGPFALAHLRVHGDVDAAQALLVPMAHHLADHGIGSVAEIFEGDPPHAPRGCAFQAWSVAETLRAWMAVETARTSASASRPA